MTHQQLRDSTTGNCVPQDSCKLLSISSRIHRDQPVQDTTAMSIIRRQDFQLESATEVDEVQQLIVYEEWPNLSDMSLYCENVVDYIAGFVVRAVNKKLFCTECSEVLSLQKCDNQAPKVTLVDVKDCGGLVRASADVVKVCKTSESVFRLHMKPGAKPSVVDSLKSTLLVEILTRLVGLNLFAGIDEHVLSSEPLSDHRTMLMKEIIQQYLVIRLHHQAKSYTRVLQGEKVRSFLNKTVTFKGQ